MVDALKISASLLIGVALGAVPIAVGLLIWRLM